MGNQEGTGGGGSNFIKGGKEEQQFLPLGEELRGREGRVTWTDQTGFNKSRVEKHGGLRPKSHKQKRKETGKGEEAGAHRRKYSTLERDGKGGRSRKKL